MNDLFPKQQDYISKALQKTSESIVSINRVEHFVSDWSMTFLQGMLDDIVEENKESVLKYSLVRIPLKLKLFTLDMYHDGGVTTDYELATILKRINEFYGSKIEN